MAPLGGTAAPTYASFTDRWDPFWAVLGAGGAHGVKPKIWLYLGLDNPKRDSKGTFSPCKGGGGLVARALQPPTAQDPQNGQSRAQKYFAPR